MSDIATSNNTAPLFQGRLVSIDALRGAAALAVVLYHAAHKGVFNPEPARVWAGAWEWLTLGPFSFGYVGVYLFFVISGFCIHLKVAKSLATGKVTEIDFRAFWKRRLRRLYPAYFAALLLYLAVAWGWNGDLNLKTNLFWDLTSHLLLIHNLDPRTVFSLNGVFWTLALEEQLYLAYFLLLWLRRKHGWTRALLICAGVRLAWWLLAWALQSVGVELVTKESAAANWCVWALGAVAVENYFGALKLPRWCYDLRLASFIGVCAGALAYGDYLFYETGRFAWWAQLLMQPLWGLAFFIVINRAVRGETWWNLRAGATKRIKWLTGLGLISYSLYLTHELVFHVEKGKAWLTVPLSVLVAWLFFQIFEKPFLTSPVERKTPPPAEDYATPPLTAPALDITAP
jgi:peptidoglycan/LPS O-acetylase OafA/YrhL